MKRLGAKGGYRNVSMFSAVMLEPQRLGTDPFCSGSGVLPLLCPLLLVTTSVGQTKPVTISSNPLEWSSLTLERFTSATAMLSQILFPLVTLPILASAHFKTIYPPARGFDEEILGTAPCGGQVMPSNSSRTTVSLTSIPIAHVMGHYRSVIQNAPRPRQQPQQELQHHARA